MVADQFQANEVGLAKAALVAVPHESVIGEAQERGSLPGGGERVAGECVQIGKLLSGVGLGTWGLVISRLRSDSGAATG